MKTSNFTRRKFEQVLQLWPNHSSLLKKLSLDYPGQILVVFHCLLDFNYMAYKGLLCGIFVHLESHHIASKSFEIFPTSPNNLLLMNKLCLAHWWYTWEKLLEFTCAFNILCAWISESLKYLTKSHETFHKLPFQYSLLKKISFD